MLGSYRDYYRILVTPGLLELGEEETRIHQKLGQVIASNVDLVMLVGKNERTRNLASGINDKVKIIWLDKTLDFVEQIKLLNLKKETLTLIENDIPESEL